MPSSPRSPHPDNARGTRAQSRPRWLERTRWMVALAFLVPPWGLYLLWRRAVLSRTSRWAVTVTATLLWIGVISAGATGGGNGTGTSAARGAAPPSSPSSTPTIAPITAATAQPSPVASTQPTSRATAPPLATPAPTAVPTPAPPPPPAATATRIVSVTSPVAPGAYATVVASTAPNAGCDITVRYKSGISTAQGLTPQTADGSGHVSWTWKVGTRTTPGSWPITVECTPGGADSTQFTVS
jgi:hypothetical protein